MQNNLVDTVIAECNARRRKGSFNTDFRVLSMKAYA
jgi:hypothetical protein